MAQMKKIKLDKETTKKFKEALDVFMVNPKKGNAMLDKIYEEQQRDDAASADSLEEARKSQEKIVKDF